MLKRILLALAFLASAGIASGQEISTTSSSTVVFAPLATATPLFVSSSSGTTTTDMVASDSATSTSATSSLVQAAVDQQAVVEEPVEETDLSLQGGEEDAPKFFNLVYGGFEEFVSRAFGWE